MPLYGIMQGRLTKPEGRGIQFFPFEYWEEEFKIAKKLGLDEIEFIFDYEDYEKNPLWTEEGQKKIHDVVKDTKVNIHSICFDYFMRRPFFKETGEVREELKNENKRILLMVLQAMKRLGIGLIEIPLVDNSSLKNEEEKEAFREFLLDIVDLSERDILFGLETDMPPHEFAEFIQSVNHENVGANYDSGNSSGLGYDAYEEVTVLGNKIFNIHIKDRVYQGTTVALGTGSADFEKLFKGLREISYKGSFILQAARGEDGAEKETIQKQITFVKEYIKKYHI